MLSPLHIGLKTTGRDGKLLSTPRRVVMTKPCSETYNPKGMTRRADFSGKNSDLSPSRNYNKGSTLQ